MKLKTIFGSHLEFVVDNKFASAKLITSELPIEIEFKHLLRWAAALRGECNFSTRYISVESAIYGICIRQFSYKYRISKQNALKLADEIEKLFNDDARMRASNMIELWKQSDYSF